MAETRPEVAGNPEEVVVVWWNDLQQRAGDRAALRRASSPLEVVFLPVYHDLRRRLSGTPWRNRQALACMTGVLAHIRQDDERRTFAQQMASPKGAGRGAVLSGLRFRRLIQYPDRESVYSPLVRVVRLLDHQANVPDLARSIYFWSDQVRRDWAFAYYEHAPSDED